MLLDYRSCTRAGAWKLVSQLSWLIIARSKSCAVVEELQLPKNHEVYKKIRTLYKLLLLRMSRIGCLLAWFRRDFMMKSSASCADLKTFSRPNWWAHCASSRPNLISSNGCWRMTAKRLSPGIPSLLRTWSEEIVRWKSARKFLVNSLRTGRLRMRVSVVEDLILECLDSWQNKDPVNVREETESVRFCCCCCVVHS